MAKQDNLDPQTRDLVRFAAAIAQGYEPELRERVSPLRSSQVPVHWDEELILQSVLMCGYPRALVAFIAPFPHLLHEKLGQRARRLRPLRLLLGQKHLHVRILPAQVGRERAIAQDHLRPHTSRQRSARICRRPRQQRAVGVCRIGRRQLHHLHATWVTPHSPIELQRPQQLHSGRRCKLRRSQFSNEVSSPDLAALFKRLHHVVDRGKAA